MPRIAVATLFLASAVLAAASPVAAVESRAIPATVAEDDECQAAAPGSGADSDGGCSLNMLQLNGRAQAQAQAVVGSSAHAAVWDALGQIRHGLTSALDDTAHGQDDSCRELLLSAQQQCFPSRSSLAKMTFKDMQVMCGCKGSFLKMKACPEAIYRNLAAMELHVLGWMCSPCGMALSKLTFDSSCVDGDSPDRRPLYDKFCGSECHASACGVLSACSSGHKWGPISAREVGEMRGNITEATERCSCPSS